MPGGSPARLSTNSMTTGHVPGTESGPLGAVGELCWLHDTIDTAKPATIKEPINWGVRTLIMALPHQAKGEPQAKRQETPLL